MKNIKFFQYVLFFIFIYFFTQLFIIQFSKFKGYKTLNNLLLENRIVKINNSKNVKTIFFGDSSLGNAIDEDLFSKISGKQTINLALSGSYSFGGAYGLLENFKKDGVENIYIMSSLHIWRRSPSNAAYNKVKSQKNIFLKEINYIKMNLNPKSIKKKFNYLRNKQNFNNDTFENDYIKQSESNFIITKFYSVNKKKIYFLKKIFEFCKLNNINCKHYHGPIVQFHCENEESIDYINNVNKLLETEKIQFQKNLNCMEDYKLGDGDDHIAPKYKKDFTKIFYNQL